MVNVLDGACTRWGMTISGGKTKLLAGEQQHSEQPLNILKGQALEEVESFSYLGSEVGQDGRVEKEVAVRLEKQGPFTKCGYGRGSKAITSARTPSCVRAFRTLVMPVLLCGAETWTVSNQDLRKLKTFVPHELSS